MKAPARLLLLPLLLLACTSETGGAGGGTTTTNGSGYPACSNFSSPTVAACFYADDGSYLPDGPVSGTVTDVVPTGKTCVNDDAAEWVGYPPPPAFHVHLTDASTGVGYWAGFALPGFSPQIAVGDTVTAEARAFGGDITPSSVEIELSREGGLIAYVGEERTGKLHLPGGLDYSAHERYCEGAPGECQTIGLHLFVGDDPVPLGGTLDIGGHRVIDGGAFIHVDRGACDAGEEIRIGVLPAP